MLLGKRSASRNATRGRSKDKRSGKSGSANVRVSGNGPGCESALEIVTVPGYAIGHGHRIAVTGTEIDLATEELDHAHATVLGTVREIDIDDAEAEMTAEDDMKKSRRSSPRRNFLALRRRLWRICSETASVWLPSSLS